MGVIAVYNKFCAVGEIAGTFRSMGKKTSLFSSEAQLSDIKNGEAVDFVMDINFHENVRELCVKYDLPYVVWSFDSGVKDAVALTAETPLRDKDFLFLFNRLDYAECLKMHENTYFLPFSASESFLLPVRKGGFDCDVLLVMNSFNDTVEESEAVFRKILDVQKDEMQQKSYVLIKSLMDLVVERHKYIFDRDLMPEFLREAIAGCGVDPFSEDRKQIFCNHYGQILSSFQREICIREICRTGRKVHVYGDRHWEKVLKPFENARFFPGADYDRLASLYNGAKINVNLTQIQNLDSIPQRIFHVLGAGAFLISNYSDEVAAVFSPSVHLETFRGLQELAEKINYYLENEDARTKIAEAGHEEFVKNHKMDSRIAFILSQIAEKNKKS